MLPGSLLSWACPGVHIILRPGAHLQWAQVPATANAGDSGACSVLPLHRFPAGLPLSPLLPSTLTDPI